MLTKTNAPNCLLNHVCRSRNDPSTCTRNCPHFIALHGYSGDGGRTAAAAIPRDYRLVTVTTSPIRADQPKAYELIDAYVRTFRRMFDDDARQIKSLYLWSREPGTGKTTTAVALLNEWLIRHYVGAVARGLRPDQRPAFFFDVNEWHTLYNGFNRPRVPDDVANSYAEQYYTMMEITKVTPFVVLDDIGIRKLTDGVRGDLHTIINHRVTNRLPTVYTSNLPMDELPQMFGERRLYDRMRDMCVEIEFEGESKRGIR